MNAAGSGLAGSEVARALDDLHALLAPAEAWTSGAFARDATGAPLNRPADIRDRAVCRCLLGGVETVTDRLDLQMAVTQALAAASRAAGEAFAQANGLAVAPARFSNLSRFNDHSPKGEVLEMIVAAGDAATARTWSTWSLDTTFPGRPPTSDEENELLGELQYLGEMYFASDAYAGQYDSTPTIVRAVRARERALAAYLTVHGL